jgi:hypothetical protein
VVQETTQSEWTLFNDDHISNQGGWTNIIEYCVEFQCYPTVIFYERVEPTEMAMLREITIDTPLIELLYNKANEAMSSMDFEGGYT